MQIAAKAIASTRRSENAGHPFAGMLLVSLFPALFWSLSAAGIGAAVGHTPSATALTVFGAAIAAFCAVVFQALVIRR